jgi:HAD superfamily hydrolase (TIGR01509 family)
VVLGIGRHVTPQTRIRRPYAVLLDIDGTLVDSNYLNVFAWLQAFTELHREVPAWKIHRAIGMDSDLLLAALLGEEDARRVGDQAKELHAVRYAGVATLLRVLPGAREMVVDLADWGIRAVLATSAPPEELGKLRSLLEIEDAIFAVTGANDVETAKPAPDIVEVALRKAGADAAEALFVGDTVWDVQAALKSGVACVGLLSGGYGRAELTDAGAIAVFDDIAALNRAIRGTWNA